MKQQEIIDTMTAQPLSLTIHSFMKATQQAEGIQAQDKRLPVKVSNKNTCFTQPDQTMNHTWIDTDTMNDNNQKANKLLVPSAMWYQIIHLTFPGRRRIVFFNKTCHTMLLRSYRQSLLLSFLNHLELTCPLEHSQ